MTVPEASVAPIQRAPDDAARRRVPRVSIPQPARDLPRLFAHPRLPPGRLLELPGRGTTFVCETGPRDGPVLMLVHGLACTAYLNWFPAFYRLAKRFRVVAFDLRGHGRGISAGRRFRLADCADDAAAIADVLGIERFTPVGYSLGGPVAQLVAHRHRGRVEGLVLCATARNFRGRGAEALWYRAALPGILSAVGAARLVRRAGQPAPDVAVPAPATVWTGGGRLAVWGAQEMRTVNARVVMQAMHELGRFNSAPWVGEVDVPAALVVTQRDRFISPVRQLRLAEALPDVTVHHVDAGHPACFLAPRKFVPVLAEACASVADRVAGGAVGATG